MSVRTSRKEKIIMGIVTAVASILLLGGCSAGEDETPSPVLPSATSNDPNMMTPEPAPTDTVPGATTGSEGDTPIMGNEIPEEPILDMETPQEYIEVGEEIVAAEMPLTEATALVESLGATSRVVSINGEDLAITMDYSPSRFNFTIVGEPGVEIVTDVTFG